MKKYLVIVMLVLTVVLSGCGSKAEMDYEPQEEYGFSNEDTELEDNTVIPENPTDQGGDVANDSDVPAFLNRKIIYTANLEMSVMNPTLVYNEVLDTVSTFTAYIEEADITTDNYKVTFRVLSTEFDEFVEALKTSGDLVAYSKTSEDVTNTYSTFEAQKLALETRHERILELIAVAVDLDTILDLEEERYQIEASLNLIGTKLANYDSLVDYSTVTLEISKAVEEIIVLARTEAPNIYISETTKNTITMELYNYSDENVTLHVDAYLNGEFVTEFEENTFSDSKTIVTFEDLKSNQEYTFKVTSLATNHRVSLLEIRRVDTEKTYGNKITNVFGESVSLLSLLFEFLGLAVTALLPFAITATVILVPARIIYLKRKKTISVPEDIEE